MRLLALFILTFFSLLFQGFSLTHDISKALPSTLDEILPALNLQEVRDKIVPSIVHGTILRDNNGFKKGEVVEVLEDVANGTHYKVKNATLCTWTTRHNIKLMPPTYAIPISPLLPSELELYMNASPHVSKTSFFIWVDLARQTINVFEGSASHWQLKKQLLCATGKYSTSTIRGTFIIQDRGNKLLCSERAHHWVRFHENYLFHSRPLDSLGQVKDLRLGEPISNGCIRMAEDQAKWFFETIPSGTSVWIY